MCDMRLSHGHRVCERKLRFTAFNTANVLRAVVYGPVIVTAGFAVGYGAGPMWGGSCGPSGRSSTLC